MEPAKTTVIAKPFWESTTLWVNALGIIVLVVGIILDSASVLELSGRMVAWLGVVLAIANGILRFISNTPLASGSHQTAELPAPPISTVQEGSPPRPGAPIPPMPHVDIPPGGGRG